MNLELGLLRVLIAIEEQGNFALAAAQLRKSPASITQQVKRLEDLIGEPVFRRDARATKLTKAGERLMPYARRMLALEAEIADSFSAEAIEGEVKLGVPDDVVERFPMQVLRKIRDTHPNILLTVNVDHTPSLLNKVDSGQLDIAVITHAPSIPGVSRCERIWNEPEVWATAKTGIASERSPLPVILWEEGWAWYQDAMDVLIAYGKPFEVILQCENIGARKSAILADLGIGPLPLSQLGDELIAAPSMNQLPPLPNYGLGLKLPIKTTAAIEAIGDHIRQYYQDLKNASPLYA